MQTLSLLMAVLTISACTPKPNCHPNCDEQAPTPSIEEFKASKSVLKEGESLELTLKTRDVSSCQLFEGDLKLQESFDLTGKPYTLTPKDATTYTVECRANGQTLTESVSIEMTYNPPKIKTFTPLKNPLNYGDTAEFQITGLFEICEVFQGEDKVAEVIQSGDYFSHKAGRDLNYLARCERKGLRTEKSITLSYAAPKIRAFKAEPDVIIEGQTLRWLISGQNIDHCDIKLDDRTVTEGVLEGEPSNEFTPTKNGAYTAHCVGLGGKSQAEFELVITAVPDVFQSDLLAQIEANFPIEKIKRKISGSLEGKELRDFTQDINFDFIPANKNTAEFLNQESLKLTLDTEKSQIYGYEGNLPENLNESCEEAFDISKLLDKAVFEDERSKVITEEKEAIMPGVAHIRSFKATTESIENPVPKGTIWDVKFSVAETKATYTDSYKEYDKASGFFLIKEGQAVALKTDEGLTSDAEGFAAQVRFPDGYPIPHAKNGYRFDPTHPTCNTEKPRWSTTKWRKLPGWANDGGAARRCRQQSTDYPTPRNFFTSAEAQGFTSKWGVISEETNGKCDSYFYEIVFWPMQQLTKRQGSRRIHIAPATIECQVILPKTAGKYGLDEKWTARIDKALHFVTSRDWPSCAQGSGFSCKTELRMAKKDPSHWNNLETNFNQCLSRWVDHPWSAYRSMMQKTCLRQQVFLDAKAEKDEKNAVADLIKDCQENTKCNEGLKDMRDLIKSFPITKIEESVNKFTEDMNTAKNSGRGFLVPETALGFSQTDKIAAQVKSTSLMLNTLESLNVNINADISLALVKLLNGIEKSNKDFSYENLRATLDFYERLIDKIADISEIEIRSHVCHWQARAKFKKVVDQKILEISLEDIDSANLKLESVKNIPAR